MVAVKNIHLLLNTSLFIQFRETPSVEAFTPLSEMPTWIARCKCTARAITKNVHCTMHYSTLFSAYEKKRSRGIHDFDPEATLVYNAGL